MFFIYFPNLLILLFFSLEGLWISFLHQWFYPIFSHKNVQDSPWWRSSLGSAQSYFPSLSFDLLLISTHLVSVSLITTPQPRSTVFSHHHFTQETVKGQKQPINCQLLPRLFSLHRTPSLHGVCHWGPPSPCHTGLPSGFSQRPSSAFLDVHPPTPQPPLILSCNWDQGKGDSRQKGCLSRRGR